jgi:O-antigen/teichoic acid export membrane protein
MRRVRRDLGYTIGSLVGVKGLFFVSAVILARGLTPARFGVFTVESAIAVVLIPIVDFGLYNLVLLTRARATGSPDGNLAFTAAADRIRLVPWAVGGVVFVAATAAASLIPVALAVLTFVGAVSQSETDTIAGELRGSGRFAASAWLRSASGGLSIPVALAVAAFWPTAVGAMLVFTGCRLVPVMLVRLRYARTPLRRMPEVSFRAGFPFAAAATIIILYVQSDVIFMAMFRVPDGLIASYGVAYSVLLALQTLPVAINYVSFPRMARAGVADARRLAELTIVACFVVSAVAVAAALAWPTLTFRVFGPHYSAESAVVIPLVSVLLPLSASLTTSALLQARHRQRLVMQITFGTFVVNIGLNLLLIPHLGVRGALISTSVAEGLSACAGAYALVRAEIAKCLGLTLAASLIPLSMTIGSVSASQVALLALLGAIVVVVGDLYGTRASLLSLLGLGVRRAPS